MKKTTIAVAPQDIKLKKMIYTRKLNVTSYI